MRRSSARCIIGGWHDRVATSSPVEDAIACAHSATLTATNVLRCGLVVQRFDTGGIEEVVAMLARGLPSHDIEAHVLCTHSGGSVADRLRTAGVPVTIGDGSPRTWRAWLKETKPDVISAHAVPLKAVERLARSAPIVETIHNTNVWLSPSEWDDERRKCRIATTLVAVSETVAAYHQHVCGPHPMQVIPNGVDARRLVDVSPQAAREQLGFGADDLVLVQVGRFCIQKNQLGLVDILVDVLDGDARIKLVLLGADGDPGYRERVEARAAAQIARGAVRTVPYSNEPGLVIAAADALISNSYFEGWSLAATEGVWLGKPLILSDCGGARELVGADGRGGILVPNPGGDPATLAWDNVVNPPTDVAIANRSALQDAVRAFARDRDRWEARSAAISAAARARYSSEQMIAAYAAVFQAAVARKATAPLTLRGVLRHYWRSMTGGPHNPGPWPT
jgi:glycosyltransferase involved in cell wall biosynthesis